MGYHDKSCRRNRVKITVNKDDNGNYVVVSIGNKDILDKPRNKNKAHIEEIKKLKGDVLNGEV